MSIRFFIICCCIYFPLQSLVAYQVDTTSSKKNDYQYLKERYYDYKGKDTLQASEYAKMYLAKAKQEKDSIKIADGYYYLSWVNNNTIALQYGDSILNVTKNYPSKIYPTYAYIVKATVYYNISNYKEAFEYYIKINEEAKKYDNTYFIYWSELNIGILRSRLGDHKNALKTLRTSYAYYAKPKEKGSFNYFSALFALSDSYHLNKKLDSASIINTKGYKESIQYDQKGFTHYFTLNEGINLYSKQKYTIAKDSLQRAIQALKEQNDKSNESMAYFYLAKTETALGNEGRALEYHKRVDELFQEIHDIMPENRESYEVLIDHYKKTKDKENQLKYIERLIEVDSTIHSNYKYLISEIVQNYDTPRLLSEKQEIIDSLETDKKSSVIWIVILVMVALLFFILLILNYHKRKVYKRRFDALYQDKPKRDKKIESLSENKTESKSLGISEDIVQKILDELDKFEQRQDYLQKNITSNDLSKKINTNSKYLSKVVNHYKQKSLSLYINELRIQHAVTRLKTDPKFRNYTIIAIARECGFNSADAFSKSFYKIHGIQPSYFIKKLGEKQNF
ncbi:helix-turn-helix domain-containing protein [Aquimarina sp. MMG016]|uniref:helix-turn-helix domain-containing protein n=1 Tax=Aquimarina sp. MMG016 TaxID=2822690 RepID=UPI001B39D906|nr:helix-turn-helix domain-containing protein [Aquimarina sp. MMG016]MBQ4821831.1 helix-turn-helix domain-containing protein [Aquimarina sp. MMG016]